MVLGTCVLGRCKVPGPLGCGGDCGVLPGVVVPVVVPGVAGPVVVVPGVVGPGAAGAAVPWELCGGAGAGDGAEEAHDSDMLATLPSPPGSEIDDGGVPGGTFTPMDNCAPPSRVTVSTQGSAEAVAVGKASRPIPPTTRPAVTAATFSFPLNTVVSLLPRDASAVYFRRDHMAARRARYRLSRSFATSNRLSSADFNER